MRIAERNKQPLKYATLVGEETVYEKDAQGNRIIDYIDEEGNVYYRILGTKTVYNAPVDFKASIAFSSDEIQAVEFGVDVSNYDATLLFNLNEFPITETTYIWYKSTPEFVDGVVDINSADYKVISVKPSRRYTKVILKRLVKQGEN